MLVSLLQRLAAASADPNFLSITEDLSSDPHGGVALVTHDHDIRKMNRRFFFQDAAGLLRPFRARMSLN